MLDQMEDAADQRAGLPVPGPAETAMARSFALTASHCALV